MAQWSKKDEANGAPKFTVDAATGRSGVQEYGNTVFGVKASEQIDGAGSPGWVRVVEGKGRVVGVEIVASGSDYANTDFVTVGSASGTITTDAYGAITDVTITLPDTLVDSVPTVTITTETGSGAILRVVTEGRIGRKYVETLVSMRNITD